MSKLQWETKTGVDGELRRFCYRWRQGPPRTAVHTFLETFAVKITNIPNFTGDVYNITKFYSTRIESYSWEHGQSRGAKIAIPTIMARHPEFLSNKVNFYTTMRFALQGRI